VSGAFDGTVAVVTGAAQGIGRACAELLAERGASVVGVDIAEGVIGPRAVPAPQWRGVVGDVSDSSTVETALAEARTMPGRLAVLINAAFSEHRAELADSTDDGWSATYRISTVAAVAMSRAFARDVNGPAAVVNIASIHAFAAKAEFGAYSAAKAALVALTRTAALEWGPRDIRVNAIAPGFIAVERNAKIWQGPHARRPNTPLSRFGQPHDVAAAAAFLASDEASFITGAVLVVDGGLLVRLPEEFRP